MIYTLERISRDVRAALSDNVTDREMLAYMDRETLSLDDRIVRYVEECTRAVTAAAPLSMLAGTDRRIEGQGYEGSVRWLRLPSDFMRLYMVKAKDWERSVSGEEARTGAWIGRGSRWAGLRGGSDKPRVAVVEKAGGLALEWSGGELEMASYIPLPRIETGGIEIAERIYRDVVERIAAKIQGKAGGGEK